MRMRHGLRSPVAEAVLNSPKVEYPLMYARFTDWEQLSSEYLDWQSFQIIDLASVMCFMGG
jgi:hypothetical protein